MKTFLFKAHATADDEARFYIACGQDQAAAQAALRPYTGNRTPDNALCLPPEIAQFLGLTEGQAMLWAWIRD
jgi:hypothetical protein